jgi:hypothetical protein
VVDYQPSISVQSPGWLIIDHLKACWWHNFDHDHACRG